MKNEDVYLRMAMSGCVILLGAFTGGQSIFSEDYVMFFLSACVIAFSSTAFTVAYRDLHPIKNEKKLRGKDE